MSNPADPADIEDRWRPLSAQEQTNATVLLDDAWRMLKRRIGDLETRMATETDLLGEVVRVLCAATLRVLKNPDGMRSETVDDYTGTRDASVATGLLYFTDDELGGLRVDGSSGAFVGDMMVGWLDTWNA